MTSRLRLEPMSVQSFTYTRPSPMLGSAVRIYAEAVNLNTGEKYSQVLLVPQSPPEVWLSFSAFSGFATTSTSTSSISTITYYQYVMSILSATQPSTAMQPYVNAGFTISIILIGLLMFLEITDPSYGEVGKRIAPLRNKYGLLVISLLLIFAGMVLTKIVMLVGG